MELSHPSKNLVVSSTKHFPFLNIFFKNTRSLRREKKQNLRSRRDFLFTEVKLWDNFKISILYGGKGLFVYLTEIMKEVSRSRFCLKYRKTKLISYKTFWIASVAKKHTKTFYSTLKIIIKISTSVFVSLKETRNSYFCVTPKNHQLMFVSWK